MKREWLMRGGYGPGFGMGRWGSNGMYHAYASGEFDEQAARKAYDAMAQARKRLRGAR